MWFSRGPVVPPGLRRGGVVLEPGRPTPNAEAGGKIKVIPSRRLRMFKGGMGMMFRRDASVFERQACAGRSTRKSFFFGFFGAGAAAAFSFGASGSVHSSLSHFSAMTRPCSCLVARSSGPEEPASPRHRAGVASMRPGRLPAR